METRDFGDLDEVCQYYETHVTIEPVQDTIRRVELEKITGAFRFKLAKLFMDNGQPHGKDSFCTFRDKSYRVAHSQTLGLVQTLQTHGFKVYRYKIEATLMDSRIEDSMEIL